MIQLIFLCLVSFAFAGKDYPCETTLDSLRIPHVKTKSREEFYYCFGLRHGSDRAWAMDYFRRVAHGRNAEVYGFGHLKSDLMMKLLDLPGEASRLWKTFPESQKKLLQHYADGVNKGFEQGKTAKEFLEANFHPEPWTPEDSIAVLLLQSFDQTRKSFTKDYDEEKAKESFGKVASKIFNDDIVPWENTILKPGEYQKKVKSGDVTQSTFSKASLWASFPTLFGEETGSNNWVVSKNLSRSGNAMLANDPHLDLKTPMFWYWIHLQSPEGNVVGGSVPGVPVIASGTNGKVAWGLTNSYLNTADAVFVKNLKEDEVLSFRPTVYVKFWIFKIPFFFKSFEKLKTGHRILPLEIESNHKLALRWTGFSLVPDDLIPMFDMYLVNNVEEMDQITSRVGIPSWNFVFADQKGDIGYRLVGKTYKHTGRTPFGIPEMTKEEFLAEEILNPDERPHVLKPSRNYVYTANNRHWPADAAFYGGRAYSQSFRGYRIDQMIRTHQAHDFESFRKIQCDRQIVDAQFFIPKLQTYLKAPEFMGWNYQASDDSKVLPYYRRLMDLLMEKWNVNETALYLLLNNLSDQKLKELKEVEVAARNESAGKTWGEFHVLNFPHLSKYESWVFSPEIPGVGDTHSVDPGTSKWNADRKLYEQNSGASMRMIVELGKETKVWLGLPGLNRDYDKPTSENPWKSWKNCEYQKVSF